MGFRFRGWMPSGHPDKGTGRRFYGQFKISSDNNEEGKDIIADTDCTIVDIITRTGTPMVQWGTKVKKELSLCLVRFQSVMMKKDYRLQIEKCRCRHNRRKKPLHIRKS